MTQFSSLYGARLDRELGSDDRSVLFTTARRKAAINEAQQEFADLSECLTRQSTVTLTGGTAEYDLNSTSVIAGGDFARFSKEQVQVRYTDAAGTVTVLSGDDLPRREVGWLNRFEPGWQVSTVASSLMQLPQVYYERMDGGRRYLGFWPTPSTGSSASLIAIVPYVAQPTAMTSDTSEPFTVGGQVRADLRPFHQGLVHKAAGLLERFRRDAEAEQKQDSLFISYLPRFVAEARTKGGTMITATKNYFLVRGRDVGEDPRR